MQFDGYSDLGVAISVAPQDVTADLEGASVDLLGFAAATPVVIVGANATDPTNYLEAYVLDSDDGVTFAAVADTDLLYSVTGAAQTGTFGVINDGAAGVYQTGYRGSKRYIAIGFNEVGTVTAAQVAGLVAKNFADKKPVNPVNAD